MKNKSQEIIKKLIRKVGPDRPSDGFIAVVMTEVMLGRQNEMFINQHLKRLLNRQPVERLPSNFTHQVMNQIETSGSKLTLRPIIGGRVWLSIVSIILVMIIGTFFSQRPASPPSGFISYFVDSGNTLNSFFVMANTIQPLYWIAIISVGTLLTIDYLIRVRSHAKKSTRDSGFR